MNPPLMVIFRCNGAAYRAPVRAKNIHLNELVRVLDCPKRDHPYAGYLVSQTMANT